MSNIYMNVVSLIVLVQKAKEQIQEEQRKLLLESKTTTMSVINKEDITSIVDSLFTKWQETIDSFSNHIIELDTEIGSLNTLLSKAQIKK